MHIFTILNCFAFVNHLTICKYANSCRIYLYTHAHIYIHTDTGIPQKGGKGKIQKPMRKHAMLGETVLKFTVVSK